jgi:hypothetical protein
VGFSFIAEPGEGFVRDPLTIPSPLRLFRRMLLATTPYGGMQFAGELLYTTAGAS